MRDPAASPAADSGALTRAPGRSRFRQLVPLAISAAAGVTLALGIVWWWQPFAAPAPPELRLDVATPPTSDPLSLALSPDGLHVVFVAAGSDGSRLWLRSFDAIAARPLPGTERATQPFWSPDGRSIGFFADLRVKRFELASGLVSNVSRAAVPAGGAWNTAGIVLHPLVPESAIFRATSANGPPLAVTERREDEGGHRFPVFLPDQRHFLHYVTGGPDVRGAYVSSLDGKVKKRLVDADTAAGFTAGHLFYVRQGNLLSQRFDLSSLAVVGEPRVVAEQVAYSADSGHAAVSVSSNGRIAYRPGTHGGRRQFVWFDRGGETVSRLGHLESSGPAYASMSNDQTRLAVQRTVDGNTDIWLTDLESATSVRVTTDTAPDTAPAFSPDGSSLVYSGFAPASGRPATAPVFHLFQKPLAGGPATVVLADATPKQVTDWSSDGQFLLYRTLETSDAFDTDLWAMPLYGDRKPFVLVDTPFEERDAQFSPDGRWVVYQSNDSGRFEIYVQSFILPGERRRLSRNGGVQPRWRADGRELFYLSLDGDLMAIPTEIVPGALHTGPEARLFRAPVGATQDISLRRYMVAKDGQRFLVETVVDEPAAPIVVILNWQGSR